jgi:hypothetical protein
VNDPISKLEVSSLLAGPITDEDKACGVLAKPRDCLFNRCRGKPLMVSGDSSLAELGRKSGDEFAGNRGEARKDDAFGGRTLAASALYVLDS